MNKVEIIEINEIGSLNKSEIKEKLQFFPFKTTLSLKPLLEYWENLAKSPDAEESEYASGILRRFDNTPELKKPIEDIKQLENHRKTLDKIMSAVFPPALKENEIKAASLPFEFKSFYTTSRFDKLLKLDGSLDNIMANLDQQGINFVRFLYTCTTILRQYYETDVTFDIPFIFKIKDPSDGLVQYYKMLGNADFVRIKHTGKPKKLSKQQIQQLINNFHDIDLWMKYIPPTQFYIEGFVLLTLVNVTPHEITSNLKNDLLEKDALISEDKFNSIQESIRHLFRIADLKVGLGLIDEENECIDNFGHWTWSQLNCKKQSAELNGDFLNSVYGRMAFSKKPVVVEDLKKFKKATNLEKNFLKKGIRSIMVAPLTYDNEIIGFLEVASIRASELKAISFTRLREILPLFSIALKRSIDERKNLIEAIIKEKCTAIHPTVAWRFEEAATKFLDQRQKDKEAEMETIVFRDVYPLYGMSDIRDSSVERNKAIKADLIEHLELAASVIEKAWERKELPVLEEISHRISKTIHDIDGRMNSADENMVYKLIKNEIEPLFDFLRSDISGLTEILQIYKKSIDPQLGLLYRKRKEYEDSVTIINEALAGFLEQAEVNAQAMFPHYFEKYKTDGVDFNIYVGQSLVKSKKFHPVVLRNLRLWQLITMCKLTELTAGLIPDLKIPLETTQLVLIHSDPLSIRFRTDEKQFDVDGAYNVRYEILKKRIDKALVEGTKERLTQPGKIAIIYSNDEIAEEYQKYIAFLLHKRLITAEVEELTLEPMQGVDGLKALRIEVDLEKNQSRGIDIDEIMEAVNIN